MLPPMTDAETRRRRREVRFRGRAVTLAIEHWRALESEADAQETSVSAVLRQAVDRGLPLVTGARKRAASKADAGDE